MIGKYFSIKPIHFTIAKIVKLELGIEVATSKLQESSLQAAGQCIQVAFCSGFTHHTIAKMSILHVGLFQCDCAV